MKRHLRSLVCFLLIAVLLLPAIPVSAAAQTAGLDYGKSGASNTSLTGAALFSLLFKNEVPLTDYEKAFLNRNFSLSYNSDVPSSYVSATYDGTKGTLTVTAQPYQYRANHGEMLTWVPQSVTKQGESTSHPLDANGSYVYSGLWNSGSCALTVEYKLELTVPAQTADAILVGLWPSFSEAQAVKNQIREHDTWETKNNAYQAYLTAKSNYEARLSRWQEAKNQYEQYETALAEYNAACAAYQKLKAEWDAYNQYQTALAKYNSDLAAVQNALEEYTAAMEQVNSRVAIMETIFETDSHGWCLYNSLMGETVDAVLSADATEAATLGITNAVNGAKNATPACRSLLSEYNTARSRILASPGSDFEHTKALFEAYQTIYAKQYGKYTLQTWVKSLFNNIRSIYTNFTVYTKMSTDYSEQLPHFNQFLAQLYAFWQLLDDTQTLDLGYKIPNNGGTVGDLVEPALRPTDKNKADPHGITCPESEVQQPVAPTPVAEPSAPLPATDPATTGAPKEVSNPGAKPQIDYTTVADPGPEPADGSLSDYQQELLDHASDIRNRTAKGKDQTLTFTQTAQITKSYENKRTVTFLKDDGTTDTTQTVEYGQTLSSLPESTKSDTPQYHYTFNGWLHANTDQPFYKNTQIKENITLKPSFSKEGITYTVTWKLENGEADETSTYQYDDTPVYDGVPRSPTHPDPAKQYRFAGWSPEITTVTGNQTYTAQWQEEAKPKTLTVTWKLDNNTIYQTQKAYNGQPLTKPADPTRPGDDYVSYKFAGWNPTPAATVTQDQTYTAKWERTVHHVKVTWDLGYGTPEVTTVASGETPSHANPTRPSDEEWIYTFVSWNKKEISDTEITYTAIWNKTQRYYTVTWNLGDGTTPATTKVEYEQMPAYEGTPTHQDDGVNNYTFKGWTPAFEKVTSNQTYTAQWDSTPKFCQITWDLGYGTPEVTKVAYGEMPSHAAPSRPDEGNVHYVFEGWNAELRPATGDVTYQAVWKQVSLHYQIKWDLGFGTPETVQATYGETPSYAGTPERPDEGGFCYTFIGWSPEIVPVTQNATYRAQWAKSPLVTNTEGNTVKTKLTEQGVVAPIEEGEMIDLQPAVDFSKKEYYAEVSVERDGVTVSAKVTDLQEYTLVKWEETTSEDSNERRIQIHFLNRAGETAQNNLVLEVSIPCPVTRRINAFEVLAEEPLPEQEEATSGELSAPRASGSTSPLRQTATFGSAPLADESSAAETLRSIPVTYPERSDGRYATFPIESSKTYLYKTEYRLTYESDRTYFSPLPEYAEPGALISLDIECEYGYALRGATLVYEDGTEVEVSGTSFKMPAESLTVKLHILPKLYHVVFIYCDTVISERDYELGETIVPPEDPTRPNENGYRYVFRGWTPKVRETAGGDVQELIYRADESSFLGVPEKEEKYLGAWGFFLSPLFLGGVTVLVIIPTVTIVLVVKRKKIFKRKKKNASANEEAPKE